MLVQCLFQGAAQGENVAGEEIELPGKEASITFHQPVNHSGRQWLAGHTFELGYLDNADPLAHPGRLDAPEDKQGLPPSVGDRSVRAGAADAFQDHLEGVNVIG